jgi:parallel beta-helix repeat protein
MVVEKDDISIDGDGHAIRQIGEWWGSGIYLEGRKGVSIKNVVVQNFDFGIRLVRSSKVEIVGNRVKDNAQYGIYLGDSSSNRIARNKVENNVGYGIARANLEKTYFIIHWEHLS